MIPKLSQKNHLVSFCHKHSTDIFLSAFIFLSTFVLLAWNFKSLGFYADDSAFFHALGSSNFAETLKEFFNYVPGRNLHILWQKLIFVIVGWKPQSLPWMHLFQSAAESLVSVLFYFILRRFDIRYFPAFVGALLFALWPTRNDVHFWISSLPMNIFSTAFFLLFIFTTQSILKKAAGKGRSFLVKRLLLDSVFFIFSLFTYDQVFFALYFILFARLVFVFYKKLRPLYLPLFVQLIAMLEVAFGYYFYKTISTTSIGGPVFSEVSLQRIYENFLYSLKFNFTHISMNFEPVALEKITNGQIGWVYASFTAMLILLLFILVKNLKQNEVRESLKNNIILLLLSIILFLLAYFPVYMWYIATRHNYLPTIFIGAAIALVLSMIMSLLERKKALLVIFYAWVVLWPIRIAFFNFEEAIFKNSNMWAASYAIRKDMYTELINKKIYSTDTICVLVEDAPNIYKNAPFFSSEQIPISLAYLANIPLKNYARDCENFYVTAEETDCYKISYTAPINNDKIFALRINPFDQEKDSELTYLIMHECKQ